MIWGCSLIQLLHTTSPIMQRVINVVVVVGGWERGGGAATITLDMNVNGIKSRERWALNNTAVCIEGVCVSVKQVCAHVR